MKSHGRTPTVFWSASFHGANGQAIVTARVAQLSDGISWRMAVYPAGPRGLLGFLRAVLVLWWTLVAGRGKQVYVVCSRSALGFLRDVPALLPSVFGVRVIVHAHGSELPDLLSRGMIWRMARYFYRRCEVIVPSTHLLAPLAEAGCKRIHLVENFSSPVARHGERPQTGEFRVLWNSNIMASKGIRELVEAARIAHADGLGIRLIILGRPIGDGEATTAEMSAFCRTLSAIDWVDLRGPVTPDAAARAVVEADLVALPSWYASECQPLAIVQAMSAGCKVIVADTPAMRATLGSYPGRLVEPEPNVIALAIMDEAASPALDPAAAAEATARFDPLRFDRQMAAILTTGKL